MILSYMTCNHKGNFHVLHTSHFTLLFRLSFPTFTLPFSFDIHTSPVTTLHYCGKCPDDFVAELQSVLSKMPQKLKSIKVHVCVCTCKYMCVHVCVICVYMYVSMRVYVHVCVYVCL